ncbi:MAG TPA: phytoene/squalene synthase family protein [Pelomicrobium sp.]|nr:phytoene/squalene synthase family protein [Pelomicrobium sp.]
MAHARAIPDAVEAPAADTAFQHRLLGQVSRTFALTIPQLPPRLRAVVGNAYLLCRIADTIEDDALLPAAAKRRLLDRFAALVAGAGDPALGADLDASLAAATPAAERELCREVQRVAAIAAGFAPAERAAVARCVRIMADGMAWFQEQPPERRVPGLDDLDRYCYVVAGVVGEMLTEVFCQHDERIAGRRDELMELARSFGQGLQMTNVLKDVWEDYRRGACWLPQALFRGHGVDLARLAPGRGDAAFRAGLRDLAARAHGHLRRALDYTLRIPADQAGLRRFCLWALFMAMLTLGKLTRRLDYAAGAEVKISRRTVRGVVLATSAAARWDWALERLFTAVAAGLPPAQPPDASWSPAPPRRSQDQPIARV